MMCVQVYKRVFAIKYVGVIVISRDVVVLSK